MKRVSLAALAVAVTGTLCSPGAPAVERVSTGSAEALEAGLLDRLNALRARKGLGALRPSRGLESAAHHHARDMARNRFCGHESANGTSFQKRLWRYYGSRPGWRFWSVAENVLCHPRRVTAVETIGKWLGSPGHRANLLSGRWREVGLAAVYGGSGRREMVFVTADFGVRR